MAPTKVLFSFLFSLLFLAMLFKKVESQITSFSINTFTPHSILLKYENDAFVPPDRRFVRLTAVNGSGWPRPSSFGRALYTRAVTLWANGLQASFQTTVVLRVHSAGPLNTDTLGHGITFFMIRPNSTTRFGGEGEHLGIYGTLAPNDAPFFAVEFDHGTGGLNPRFSHIGINIKSQRSQNLTVGNIFMTDQLVTARITYDAPTKMINVDATYGNQRRTVSFFFNLAGIFPRQVQIGLSGSTGRARIGYLDVYSWDFFTNMVPDAIGVPKNNADIKPYEM